MCAVISNFGSEPMIRMKSIINIISILLFSLSLSAQGEPQPIRLEFDARPNTEPFQIVPLGSQGVVVIAKTNEFEDRNNRKWGFAYYDSNLELQWEFVQPLLRNLDFIAFAVNRQEVSLLFYDPKSSSGSNFQMLTIIPETRKISVSEFNTDRRFEPVRFLKQDEYCYLGLNSKNNCKVIRIHSGNGDNIELTLNASGGLFVENINADTIANEIVVLTSLRNERRRNALYLNSFDEQGNEKRFQPLIKGENRKMATSAEYVPLNNQSFLVLGSYTANPQRRSSVSEPEGSRSTGFYKVLFESGSNNTLVQYYSFSEMANLESYIRGTIAEKRQRSLRQLFQGSRNGSFEHHLVVHRVLARNGAFILSGEAFTPDFRTVTTVAYDYYGRPVPRSYSVFDGYRYSHAIVVAFNDHGHLLWDNGMEMINIRTFDLNPKLVLYNDSDGLAMAYNHEGKIAWKLIRENTTITNTSYANIETRFSKDRVNSEQGSRLFYWYGNYFLASGYQTITNNYLPGQNRRSIFYVNKIAFD